jgi:hypothetical protein
MPEEPTTFTRVLEKRLEVATRQKKRFMLVAVISLAALLLILALIYKRTVLDYARITNVTIEQQGNTPQVEFQFDVESSGRVDYRYGKARLLDQVNSGQTENFLWSMSEDGEVKVGIRSRGAFLPKWHAKTIVWSMEEQLEAGEPAEQ